MTKQIIATAILTTGLVFPKETARAGQKNGYEGLDQRVKALEETVGEHKHLWRVGEHEHGVSELLKGLSVTGQMTMIYQNSDLKLKNGDLDTTNSSSQDFRDYDHKSGTGTFSADLFIEKEFGDGDYFLFNVEFANGTGVDAPLQGGAMVNNEVMEDVDMHNEPYIARAYYEHTRPLSEGYNLIFDLGKFGVPDFFDEGERVADQTTQFLNQAICNNGAFDYVQDLEGHGYTYGARAALETPWVTLSGAFMSSDSHLDNISDKHSVIGAVSFEHEFYHSEDEFGEVELNVNLYVFKNYGEYAAFDGDGNLVSKDPSAINTENNKDDLDKGGFGVSLNQSLPRGINLFAKYGRQDDDRDVRHYQDMDETVMFGFDVPGRNWGRDGDVLGVAYEIGKLTGNHRKAHEKGYQSFFDRPGVGAGNYADEEALEIYYKVALTEHAAVSLDYQHIENFYYSSKIGAADFWGARFNLTF